MPRKAAEILKSQGYTDEEITAMATMLSDPRFIKTLETQDAANEKLTADLAATTEWYNKEALPTINRLTTDAVNAKSEAARLKAQMESEQAYGLRRIQQQEEGVNPAADPKKKADNSAFDESKFVSAETFLATTDQFGAAIATATDIAEDYRELFGQRIPGGVTNLRKEYQAARAAHTFNGDLAEFADKKFGFTQKRQELVQVSRQKELDDVRADERRKILSESANPMTRLGSTSRNPFVQKVVANGNGTTGGNKQPWEQGDTVEQRRGQRVVKFASQAMEKAG